MSLHVATRHRVLSKNNRPGTSKEKTADDSTSADSSDSTDSDSDHSLQKNAATLNHERRRVTNIKESDFRPSLAPHPRVAKSYTVRVIHRDNGLEGFLANAVDIEIRMRRDLSHEADESDDETINFFAYIFENIIHALTKHIRAGDQLRFILQSGDLDYPISTNLLPADSPSINQVILYEIMRVLQSKEDFKINGCTINVWHVTVP